MFRHTKIVATVPSWDTEEKLFALMVDGVDVFRLNFSHGDNETKARRLGP